MLDYNFKAIEIPRTGNLPPLMMVPTRPKITGGLDTIVYIDAQMIARHANATLKGMPLLFNVANIESSIRQAIKTPDFERNLSHQPLPIPTIKEIRDGSDQPIELGLKDWQIIAALANLSLIFMPLQASSLMNTRIHRLVELENIQPIPVANLEIPKKNRIRRMVSAYMPRQDKALPLANL